MPPRPSSLVTKRFVLLALLVTACADDLPPEGQSTTALARADQLTLVQQTHDRFTSEPVGVEVAIVVDGKNLATRKVGVRYAADGGAWLDVEASRKEARNAATDVFYVQLPRPKTQLAYAVWAEAPGQRLWDSAGGKNYEVRADAPVRLAGQRLTDGGLEVWLDVANLAYDKQCGAVWTSDGWMNARYAFDAQYVGAGAPGREIWRIVLSATAGVPGPAPQQAATLEYALSCRFGGGEAQWDNNRGRNHRFERATPPLEAWRQPFGDLVGLVAAGDGTTFALATNDPPQGNAPGSRRFLTVYAPDGGYRGSLTLPADPQELTWLPKAQLLLARVWSDGAPRWVGVTAQATIAWDVTLDAPALVRGGAAELLVGPTGFARLGATAPTLRTVDGGCAGPAMAGGTRLVCEQATRNAAFDTASGALVKAFPAGRLWAVGGDGTVVLAHEAPMTSGLHDRLVGYNAAGLQRWSKSGLYLPASDFGARRVAGRCDNHAAGDFAAYTTRPPTSELGTLAVVLFDVTSGSVVKQVEPGTDVVQACPDVDGRFYWNPSYMRYGQAFSRVWTDGRVDDVDLGYGGRVIALASDGRIAHVYAPYYRPDGPLERVIVRGADGSERHAQARVPSGTFAGATVAATSASTTRLVGWDGGALVAIDVP